MATAPVCVTKLSPFHISNRISPTPASPPCRSIRKLGNKAARKWKLRAEARGFGPDSNRRPSKLLQDPKNDGIGGSDDEDEIPKAVMERMSVRIVASVVTPMGLGLGFLSVFGALRDQNVWDVPLWVPVATSFFTFGASALGIPYGALSTSWDPDTKGSFLGLEQLERNWVELWKQ
uniref:Uncharacterized protein n=1 Tax=Kalanchoe fedtschenkoi TaxID=63787 RepID=A0A7N0V368_KALFE